MLHFRVAQRCDMDSVTEVQLYQLWPALNRHSCSGRITLGPRRDCGYNLCLWLTILVPVTFFCALPAPVVWVDISPAIVLSVAGLTLICIILFLLTSYSDPGYIPRKEIQVLLGIQDETRQLFGISCERTNTSEKVYLDEEAKLQIENEFDERLLLTDDLLSQGYKYCATCRIIRPPRASHCSDCQNCCLRHDHHCPFVNNCVGHRNYMFFTAFIVSAIVLGLMILLSVILWVSDGYDSIFSPRTIRIIAFSVGIPVGLLLLAAIGFFAYHTYLTCTGQTTRENLTGRRHNLNATLASRADPRFISTSFFSMPPRLYPSLNTRLQVPIRRSLPAAVVV